MWDGQYSFFDNYRFIEGYSGQDYNGNGRLVFLLFTLISIPIILFLVRKWNTQKVDVFLKIVGIALPVLEIAKLSYESYYDIIYSGSFMYRTLLPLYTCSLFIYTSFLAGWGKGKVKDYSLCWITTVGLVGGLSNVIFTQGLTNYPFFTFSAMHNMFFHYMMVLTALVIVVTKYKEFTWKDIFKGFIVTALFSIIVIPVDYILQADYMLYYRARGVPFIQDIVAKLAEQGLRGINILIISALYFLISIGFSSLYIVIGRLTKAKHKND